MCIKNILFIPLFFLFSNILYAVEYNSYSKVKIQILNKVTGKVKVYDLPINQLFNIDDKLSLIVKACYKTTQKYAPEDVMFLQVAKSQDKVDASTAIINNTKILNNANSYVKQTKTLSSEQEGEESAQRESKLIFSGWIFSNHPDISSLADPNYDISIIKCIN